MFPPTQELLCNSRPYRGTYPQVWVAAFWFPSEIRLPDPAPPALGLTENMQIASDSSLFCRRSMPDTDTCSRPLQSELVDEAD
jgi:hypothetical protein